MKTWKQFTFLAIPAIFGFVIFTGCESFTEPNETPTILDFNISGTGTFEFDGTFKTVTVTAKEGKTTGEISVYYTGTDGTEYPKAKDAPLSIGKYSVTFDADSAKGWDKIDDLAAGTLTIIDGTPGVPADLKASVESETSVKISWDSVPKADSYNIYFISETDDLTPNNAYTAVNTAFRRRQRRKDLYFQILR